MKKTKQEPNCHAIFRTFTFIVVKLSNNKSVILHMSITKQVIETSFCLMRSMIFHTFVLRGANLDFAPAHLKIEITKLAETLIIR